MKLLLAILLLFALPAWADTAPLCAVPTSQYGFGKQFYGTNYSFTYDDRSKKLYFVLPSTQYTLYTNIAFGFAHSFTHITDTPAAFLTGINSLASASGVLQAETCSPLLTETNSNILTYKNPA